MPMSAAALNGVSEWGLRWRGHIAIDRQIERLRDVDRLKIGDCATIRDEIVKVVRTYAANLVHHRARDWAHDLAESLVRRAADLDECEDDPDELRIALDELFDTLDYYRVVAVR
jgi:hypothetical protein